MFVNLLAVHFGCTIFTKSDYRKVFHSLLSFNFATSVNERIVLSHSVNENDDDKHTSIHTISQQISMAMLPIFVEKLNYQKKI